MSSDKSYATEARLSALINGLDTWHNLGSLSAGWTVTVARYRAIGMGLVVVEIQGLVPGATIAGGTVIWSAANGLPSGYRPSLKRRLVYGNAGTAGSNPTELEWQTDGSVQCQNIVATVTGMDGNVLLSTL
jgi:hypothetical protein